MTFIAVIISVVILTNFLQTATEMTSFAKPTGKYPAKKKPCARRIPDETPAFASVQGKLVLLTLTFPRLRIIWSSSPYATAEIFNDLKLHNSEPDPSKAIAVGAEDDAEVGAGVNLAAEELLRSLPGITAKNARYVMGKVSSVKELCTLQLEQVQDILGVEPGKACWEFIHRGERVANN
jgi:DNA excision repair protein ERCC-4